jgi:hypothetical protein
LENGKDIVDELFKTEDFEYPRKIKLNARTMFNELFAVC